ncbi:MAG: Uncharacterized protein XD63_0180 [Thermoanaerobacterales bacterium 50_218]|nr:MAG: Uncharacterized protein XD63_0180 [Thermoanaerobacterales bacterium 50_218]HAA89443.1 DUF1049 domain-containing protein [Peptococcaceae bacterium]
MQYYVLSVLVFALLIAVFAVQNAGPVSIKLFFWTVPEVPLVLVILVTVLCGFFIGLFLGSFSRPRRGKQFQDTNKLQQEVLENQKKL